MASPYRSVAGPTRPPASCSGAMNSGVPTTALAVTGVAPMSFAMPKSTTFNTPDASNMTLSGLMSRCSTPLACAQLRASATASPMAQTASGPSYARRWVNVPPDSRSITISRSPSTSR